MYDFVVGRSSGSFFSPLSLIGARVLCYYYASNLKTGINFLLAPFWRHDIFAKIIHMNLAVKFNLLKDTQPHYIYKPESCSENDNYKLYLDRTVLTDIHIQHNRPDILILNKQQKQAYLLDIAVPNSHNITQTYNTKINKYLELSVDMRNLWCLEKISILPFIISATGIVCTAISF
jgi:hypothetical protein